MSDTEGARPQGQKKTVLVVDDEQSMRELLGILLEAEGHDVLYAASGETALGVFGDARERIDLIIQDLKMPGMEGGILLQHFKGQAPDVPVIVITAFSSWDSAVEAMRLGAYDFIRKPFDTDLIRSVVARALEKRMYMKSCPDSLREEARGYGELIGNNALTQEVFRMVKLVAPTDSTVLIQGESGTGKELVARALHFRSLRRERPFLPVNCSAFTESLLESELFGHVRGAFTGAVENKQGLFRAANGGTLLLDEVADMSFTTQVKLLRVLEERKISPVGSTDLYPIDVRIIAATNKNMEEEVRLRNFREDLFYRLNVIPLFLPPLRDRKDDIPLLAGHFLAKYSRQMRKQITRISDSARQMLYHYDWPGNVRELENIIQRHVALCEGDSIETLTISGRPLAASTVAPAAARAAQGELIPKEGVSLESELESYEKGYLREALKRTDGNLTNAAKLLGMSYRSIRYRVKKLKVKDEAI